ncbi:hypothetical protein BBJ28_00006704 [Nothophytophthora sp. Chile5]|nr:hypothetical protein BBJ28_00006704 [Nothophytophthora sp. Chile5]
MRGGMFLFPLYVDPADAAAADAPEALHPVPTPTAPATGSEVFDPQRLATGNADIRKQPPTGPGKAKRALQSHDEHEQELTPRKKKTKRPLQNNPGTHGTIPGDDEANELQDCLDELNATQDVEMEDEGPPRVLITQAERIAGSVEKYSERLEQLLDEATQRQQLETFERGDMDVFASLDVKALLQSLKAMEKSDLIQKVKPELLIALMNAFDTQVCLGLAQDVLSAIIPTGGNGERQAPKFDGRLLSRLQLSLDVAICELIVMTTSQIDRRVLSEENIDNCIQLLSHIIRRLLLPCIDTSYATTASTAVGDRDSTHEEEVDVPETPKSRRRSTGSRSAGYSRVNLRTNKSLRKAIDRIIPVVCEFMEQMATLVTSVKLADRWVLHFSSSMVELFALEHSSYATSLQQSSLSVLRSIFMQYKPHRALVLEEIVGVMVKLPTAKRTLRTAKLQNSHDTIQRISTLVVSMIQSCASAQDINAAEAENAQAAAVTTSMPDNASEKRPKDKKDLVEVVLKETRESAQAFVRVLLKECWKKNEERDNRVVLENFVDDLLVMFVRPEWAGAEDLLDVLSSSLASILNANVSKDAKKPDSQYSLTALNLVGKICASIKRHQNKVAHDVLEDDGDAFSVIEEHTMLLREMLTGKEAQSTPGKTPGSYDGPFHQMALKHIVVVHLQRLTQNDSKRLLLLKFISESGSHWNGAASVYADREISLWKSLWDVSKGAINATSKAAAPTNDLGLRSSLHLVVTRDFCGLFDKLLAHVMALLSKGMPSFRARVLKSLGGIVDVDPMLMAEGGVRSAVQRCFSDERTSPDMLCMSAHVGSNTNSVLYLRANQFDRYLEALAERLRDKGISVRKSVCRIFRAFLALTSTQEESLDHDDAARMKEELHRKSACMRSLVERIGDAAEDQTIKNFIIDTFQEVWFGAELSSRQLSSTAMDELAGGNALPPGWTAVGGSASVTPRQEGSSGQTKKFVSPEGTVVQSVEEAWSAYRTPTVTPASVVKSKQSKRDDTPEIVTTIIEVIHDMTNLDWFVELLKRLMEERPAKAKKVGGRSSKSRSDEVEIAKKRSEKIVGGLVNCLVDLQGGELLQGVSISDSHLQFLSCMKAMSAFCEARPLLLSRHLETLLVYLKDEDVKIQSMSVSMVNNILSLGRISERIATMLENDLRDLVFAAPPSVVGPSIKCLATLAATRKKSPELLFKMLEQFFVYLFKYKQRESLAGIPKTESSSLQRALFTVGQIAGATDMDACTELSGDTKVLKVGTIMRSLYDVYAKFVRMPGNVSCVAKAVQGMGFLFPIRPRLFLQAQQDGLLDFLLVKAPDMPKLQCLTSLKELLLSEEQRLERGVATQKTNRSTSKEQQVQGDQEAEASLIDNVMQAQLANVLALSMQKTTRLRVEAVACIGALLVQGLVNPLQCIPNLVALETDRDVGNRDAAHAQLLALYEKFPSQFPTPSIRGIRESYAFQLNVFGNSTVFALDKDKKDFCLFGRLYTTCLRPSRTQRNLFLKALVNQFTDTGSVLQASKGKPKRPDNSLAEMKYLCYLARLISALPYDLEDEPLYIIYLINRYVSLRLGPVLDDLKETFAEAGVSPTMMDEGDLNLAHVDISEHLSASELNAAELAALQSNGRICFALVLLLRLKFALKDFYALDNEKCATYQPSDACKETDRPVMRADRAHQRKLLLPLVDDLFQAEDPVVLNWKLFLVTWRVARKDQQQLDVDVLPDEVNAKGLPKRRGRRRKVMPARQQTTEDSDDDGDDEYVPGFA